MEYAMANSDCYCCKCNLQHQCKINTGKYQFICFAFCYLPDSYDLFNLLLELSKANWTTYALGVAIVGLEFGFLCVYRAGWKISIANLFASIALACVLLIVGFLIYKEALSLRQILGMGVCAVGLILIAK